jgi:hypothetical protein
MVIPGWIFEMNQKMADFMEEGENMLVMGLVRIDQNQLLTR